MNVIRTAIALFIALAPLTAAAYIGPGSGISLLGGIWSVLVAVVLALAAILFWPIRLMIKRMKNRKSAEQADSRPAPSGDGE